MTSLDDFVQAWIFGTSRTADADSAPYKEKEGVRVRTTPGGDNVTFEFRPSLDEKRRIVTESQKWNPLFSEALPPDIRFGLNISWIEVEEPDYAILVLSRGNLLKPNFWTAVSNRQGEKLLSQKRWHLRPFADEARVVVANSAGRIRCDDYHLYTQYGSPFMMTVNVLSEMSLPFGAGSEVIGRVLPPNLAGMRQAFVGAFEVATGTKNYRDLFPEVKPETSETSSKRDSGLTYKKVQFGRGRQTISIRDYQAEKLVAAGITNLDLLLSKEQVLIETIGLRLAMMFTAWARGAIKKYPVVIESTPNELLVPLASRPWVKEELAKVGNGTPTPTVDPAPTVPPTIVVDRTNDRTIELANLLKEKLPEKINLLEALNFSEVDGMSRKKLEARGLSREEAKLVRTLIDEIKEKTSQAPTVQSATASATVQ